jgi:hypothetical protein
MTLLNKLSGHFSDVIRQRGRSYFLRGAVHLERADPYAVEANVEGTDIYQVTLQRADDNTVVAECTCPYVDEFGTFCKHIWATLLAADQKGYLRAGTNQQPRIIKLAEEDEVEPDAYWEDEFDDDEDPDDPGPAYASYSQRSRFRRPAPARRKARSSWKQSLAQVRTGPNGAHFPRETWPPGREIIYILDVQGSQKSPQGLALDVAFRDRKRDGDWSKPKAHRFSAEQVTQLSDPADQQIVSLLLGAREQTGYYSSYGYSSYSTAGGRYHLTGPQQEALIPQMCRTGRCMLRIAADDPELRPLTWDDGEPWQFWLDIVLDPKGKHYVLNGSLRRGTERRPISEPVLLLAGGLVIDRDRAARLDHQGAFQWISVLRVQGPLSAPLKQKDELLQELLQMPHLPRLELPEELRYEEVQLAPKPRLKVRAPAKHSWGPPRLEGELSFGYDDQIVNADRAGANILQAEPRRLIRRDRDAENASMARLLQAGFRMGNGYSSGRQLELAPRNLPTVVRTLLNEGWHVEAEGKLYRTAGAIKIEVTSGIDWFELYGSVDFGETTAQLPALLAALQRGENTVRLDDGTFGLLPEEWLKKYGLLAGLGKKEGDHLRFSRTQVGVLDALLAAQPDAACDEVFIQARDELRRFAGIEPLDPPAGFVGELRGYQRDGLGWLHFLQKFGFGGCLADDMGLGKTVQVLVLLEARRALREHAKKDRPGPSLVVVPRSLVFNWKQEAARFTPKLRVLEHVGMGRLKPGKHFDDYDLIITTYGTLRRDILAFKEYAFDYCILDEAQAIKNAGTESAKSVRLLTCRHRLALSGTPIENHLGELWSLFEFLNPGMLGSASVFRLTGAGARNPEPETRELLARALRPFILRRTKLQVARDLPAKLEQTLFCELEPPQRKLYQELREHYRRTLLERIEREGMQKAKIQVLEALLRLRQAACHPGLIDKGKTGDSSAKLDVLLPQIEEVLDGGHKVLVFSQFTSLLAIVRQRLDDAKIPYEYLDGRTRDRASRVERFQNDPDCKLFLISLRAGGLGLNLTAAEYVFLLDPWWNPAVEAQAIDRTHRIGQTRQVFAYRLIARDTVEEKVLELQQSKRHLADAIINADNSLIRNLGREDLELLLS